MKTLSALVAALALLAVASPASADDYLNTQFTLAGQVAVNSVAITNLNDLSQDATNVANAYEAIDNDDYNDDYRSHQRARVFQVAVNLADVKHMDDLDQSATNVGNVLNIEDDDGVFWMGDQDVHTGQRMRGIQVALNVADWKTADTVDQSALNVANQVTLDFNHPNGNIVDASNHQTAQVFQGAFNSASGNVAGNVTQAATNVGNSYSITH